MANVLFFAGLVIFCAQASILHFDAELDFEKCGQPTPMLRWESSQGKPLDRVKKKRTRGNSVPRPQQEIFSQKLKPLRRR